MNAIKASDLFAVCDQEQKGFVTKRDMQRMRDELPLDPDQLEAVFDALDADGNSYLTLEEFTEGFGHFLGIEAQTKSGEDQGCQSECRELNHSTVLHGYYDIITQYHINRDSLSLVDIHAAPIEPHGITAERGKWDFGFWRRRRAQWYQR